MMHGRDVLRHRPPFLLIGSFETAGAEAVTEIKSAFWEECKAIGLSDIGLITSEVSAQLFGCLCRQSDLGIRGAGYLLSLQNVPLGLSHPPSTVRVFYEDRDRFLHRYTAHATSKGQTLAKFSGTLGITGRETTKWVEASKDHVPMSPGRLIWNATRDTDNGVYNLSFDPSHQIFRGHFPDEPIVPGVILSDIFCQLASQSQSGTDGRPTMLLRVRFSNPVGPNDSIQVRLKKIGSEISVTAVCGRKRIARALLCTNTD